MLNYSHPACILLQIHGDRTATEDNQFVQSEKQAGHSKAAGKANHGTAQGRGDRWSRCLSERAER